ncbi:MAG: hypothetical protein DMF25_08580 [Verrucomicrobia bacterium]|nr:MAG: hypothetical protein DMF25_08580 [Verrucomicrobiota bacterium]
MRTNAGCKKRLPVKSPHESQQGNPPAFPRNVAGQFHRRSNRSRQNHIAPTVAHREKAAPLPRYSAILQTACSPRLVRLEIEKRHARIESSTELSPETSARIVENLKKKRGRDLTTEFAVNPELLGGVRIRVGSDVWDGSVRDRLERLQKQL